MGAGTNGLPFLYCVKGGGMISRRIPNSAGKSTEFINLPQLFAVSPTVEKNTNDVRSVDCESIGNTLAVNSRITDMMFNIAVQVKHAEVFRAALSGIATANTAVETPITGESVTFPDTAGVWVELANKRVSSPVIAAATLGVDYDVKYASGKICALEGSALLGTTDSISYTAGAGVGTLQEIGNLPQIEWAIHAELSDQYESGADPVLLEIDAATIDIDGGMKLTIDTADDQEHTVINFSCKCRLLPGETAAARLDGLPAQLYDWPTA